ncbi:SpoIIE family protein phosphatase [Streptomyces sp. NPDC048002]|uniref:SpoIIE family protein phosphatase n=1 Tax=unclassified Streptomyces TaxID=2593676 RepID=UPI0033C272B6
MGTHEEQPIERHRFDVADAVPVLLDAQGLVTCWTGQARRLLEHPAARVVGRPVAELLTPADAARVPELAERCRRDGGWAGLLTARHADGRPVRLMVRVVAAPEPDGPARWLALLSEMERAPGWDMSRTVLEQMVDRSPVGIAIVDTDLKFVWSNAALEEFGGGEPFERLGQRLADIQPGLDASAVEAQMRRVLETGEPVVGYEHLGHVRSAPYRETAHMMSFTRLEDARGRAMGVYYTVVDVSDRHRARRRLALLDRAGRHIGRTLDVVHTAQELADVAVPSFADVVRVDLLDSVLHGAEPSPGPLTGTAPVRLRRAGHRSEHEDEAAGLGETAEYPAGSPPIRCLTDGDSWRAERLDPLAREWATDVLGHEATLRELGLHSAMIVPVRARGVTLGITTFFRRSRKEPFDEDDLRLAEDLVSRAAVCVDNARRYTRERDAALVLQRSLLPHRLSEQDAVEVAACYRPADELTGLGGDWYDVVPLSGARVALVVGEVPGHGIGAAASMGRLRTAVRTLAALDLRPEEVLAHLDDLVGRTARDEGGPPYVTGLEGADSMQAVGAGCVYAVYDPVDGQCTMAAAGHPGPAVVLPDGEATFVKLPQGPPLGVGGPPFESVESVLAEGSVLALYTDGLLARGEADPDRLRPALERPAASLALHSRAVVDALVPVRPDDDVVLLMARTRLLGADQVADWDLPSDPAVVADARKNASRQLSAWGLEHLAFTTELVVSELVTNAIRYASGPIRLRLIRERTLICEVLDGGASAPHLRHPRVTDEGGRGLLLVSQFSQRWGTRFAPEGKIIWAEQSLTDPME